MNTSKALQTGCAASLAALLSAAPVRPVHAEGLLRPVLLPSQDRLMASLMPSSPPLLRPAVAPWFDFGPEANLKLLGYLLIGGGVGLTTMGVIGTPPGCDRQAPGNSCDLLMGFGYTLGPVVGTLGILILAGVFEPKRRPPPPPLAPAPAPYPPSPPPEVAPPVLPQTLPPPPTVPPSGV